MSPSTNSPTFAVALSMTISVGPTGRRPCSILHNPATLSVAIPPNVGGPLSTPRGVPSLPIMRAKPCTSGAASFTPGTPSTVSSALTGTEPRSSPPNSASTKLDERTYPSTSVNTSENSLSNVELSVSEKIYVPARKPVPRMMASEVRNSRPLRARVILNDSRSTALILRGA